MKRFANIHQVEGFDVIHHFTNTAMGQTLKNLPLRYLILILHPEEPLGFCLTAIHLPLTHWTMSYPFLEVGVFCRKMIKRKDIRLYIERIHFSSLIPQTIKMHFVAIKGKNFSFCGLSIFLA
ncbi:hypothetical protein COD09_23305 [Bacillus cereus]|uniref:Uncharacterized protein n=1 Tax=Bacillus cereus TaxID=1396 RepID=A0A2C1D436_BACCE|nr:hypothetical protein COD09_23305 [Bacillus cereus]